MVMSLWYIYFIVKIPSIFDEGVKLYCPEVEGINEDEDEDAPEWQEDEDDEDAEEDALDGVSDEGDEDEEDER